MEPGGRVGGIPAAETSSEASTERHDVRALLTSLPGGCTRRYKALVSARTRVIGDADRPSPVRRVETGSQSITRSVRMIGAVTIITSAV